jgi:hypothetical protein
MQEQKVSINRSQAFRSMPIRHMEGIDKRLIASMKEDGMLEDESEQASRERLLEAQYGSDNLRNVMHPRFMRDREGKQFRITQKLDGQHIDRPRNAFSLFPMQPDANEKQSDMVSMFQTAVANSEAERNKYLTRDQSRARVYTK